MYKNVKRALDVTFSLLGTAVSSPILLAVAAAIKIDSKGPVIFKQERLGKDGKVFEIYKFRSMCVGAEHMGTGQYSFKGDSRITRVGKVIRATSLDELPQFINVLKSDMSFVGPRPDVPGYADLLLGEDREILQLRPGITGPASMKYRNEEELLAKQENPHRYNDDVLFPDKVRLNRYYLHHYSFWKDIQMIVCTVLGRKMLYAGEWI